MKPPVRELKIPEPVMFSMPSLGGYQDMQHLVHCYGGRERVARDFHMSLDLVDTYLSGKLDPPLTVLLALYWQGPYGFKHGFSETHWGNHANRVRAEAAEAKLAQCAALFRVCSQIVGFQELASAHGLSDQALAFFQDVVSDPLLPGDRMPSDVEKGNSSIPIAST